MAEKKLRIRYNDSCNSGVCMEIGQNDRNDTQEIFFRSNDIELQPNVASVVCTGILPSMRMGRTLDADGTVSPKLFDALDSIIELYHSWEPSFEKVSVEGITPATTQLPTADRVALFFSGGVDSFYTLLKNFDEITDLVFVHGFDIWLEDTPLRNKTSKVIRDIGSRLGKRVIEVETNLRKLLDPHVCWGLSHGAALAAVAHLLPPEYRRIYIAATHTYEDAFPWGSHPELDYRWSTETLEFVHDGCEAKRVEKVELIANSDVALDTLRVCFRNPNGAYNCGKCEKCLRTMINLHVVGALDRCTTFDAPLTAKSISRQLAPDENTRAFFKENLAFLESRQGDKDKELYDAVQHVLQRPQWQNMSLKFARNPLNFVSQFLRDRAPDSFQILRRVYHTLTGRRVRSQ